MNNSTYELVILGFICKNPTYDDSTRTDGKDDEVFFSVNTKHVDGISGIVTSNHSLDSLGMGDTNGYPRRILAGTASAMGGIKADDSFPSHPERAAAAVPGNLYPPYAAWRDTLTEGSSDVVMVTITLWEWDIAGGPFNGFVDWLASVDTQFGATAKQVFSKIWPVTGPVFDAVSLGIQTLTTVTGFWGLGTPGNRPIGLVRDPNNPNGARWNPGSPEYPGAPLVMALTYESAEVLANRNHVGLGNGIFSFVYKDDPHLAGHYQIFVRLHKVDVPAADPRLSIWTLDAAGTRTAFVESGPFAGWIPVNCDGGVMLWRNVDGRISLWQLDAQGNRLSFKEHGPFDGFTAINYSANRILWRHVDGHISLWTVDAQGERVDFKEHGPFVGWTALDCDDTHVLWKHEDGRASLWVVDEQGAKISSTDYGPFAGYTALNHADGRILWTHTDGHISLWKLDASGVRTSFQEHGPFPGWTALNCANDNVLWRHESGLVSLWSVDDQCAKVGASDYGPFPGWTALNYADRRIVWQGT